MSLIDGQSQNPTLLERVLGSLSAGRLVMIGGVGLPLSGMAAIPLFYESMAHFADQHDTTPWLDMCWTADALLFIGSLLGLLIGIFLHAAGQGVESAERVTPISGGGDSVDGGSATKLR